MLSRLRCVPWYATLFAAGRELRSYAAWEALDGTEGRAGESRSAVSGGVAAGAAVAAFGSNPVAVTMLPAISSTAQYLQRDGSPLIALSCFFCKYKDILKEFERGKGGRCLKVKHDLKLSLQYSFYNQHVTCLALNTVYVHN